MPIGKWRTLKNQGYNFEHNYGHGKQHLSTVLITLLFLAFLVHTVLHLSSLVYQAIRHALGTRRTFVNPTALDGLVQLPHPNRFPSSWQPFFGFHAPGRSRQARDERCPTLNLELLSIEDLDAQGVTVYGPVPEPKDKNRDRYTPLPTDSSIIAEWRQRMGTEEGKAIYKQRSLVELPNAQARSRHGIQQVRVRGRLKVRCVALWVAITHNLLIWIRHLRQVVSSAGVQPQEMRI